MEITTNVKKENRTVETMKRGEVGIMNEESVVFCRKDTIHGGTNCNVWIIFRKCGDIEIYKNDYLPTGIAGQYVELLPLGTTITIKL